MIQRDDLAAAHVKDLAQGRVPVLRGEDGGLHAVRHIGVAAGLLAVAEHGEGAAGQQVLDQDVVGHVRALAGAVDREVAEHGDRHAKVGLKGAAQVLRGQLGDAVGRERLQRRVLALGGLLAVHAGGGDVDELGGLGVAGRLQQAQRGIHVAGVIEGEVAPAFHQARHGGEVEYGVAPFQQRTQLRGAQVGFHKPEGGPREQAGQIAVLELAGVIGDEGIHAHDLYAAPGQRLA